MNGVEASCRLQHDCICLLQVVLEVKGEAQLRTLAGKLTDAGIGHKLWTEQPEDFVTCLATHPAQRSKVSIYTLHTRMRVVSQYMLTYVPAHMKFFLLHWNQSYTLSACNKQALMRLLYQDRLFDLTQPVTRWYTRAGGTPFQKTQSLQGHAVKRSANCEQPCNDSGGCSMTVLLAFTKHNIVMKNCIAIIPS